MKNNPGLILAAGLGSRLDDHREAAFSKPLVRINGQSLIMHTLHQLEAVCDRVCVVLGFQRELLEDHVTAEYTGDMEITFVHNEQYHKANGLSVLAARESLGSSDFLLTMADHIVDREVMLRAAGCRPPEGGATLLVDYKIDSIFDLDDATKVQEKDGRIVTIGKSLQEYNCVDTGVFVCTQGLFDALAAHYRRCGDVSLSDGIQHLADRGMMNVCDIEDGCWQDVDTREMLQQAEEIIAKRESEVFA